MGEEVNGVVKVGFNVVVMEWVNGRVMGVAI